MDNIIDNAWASLLASVLKKRNVLRPEIGDEIDLYVPQSRLLSMLEANPDLPQQLYTSAYESARRNASIIVGKLGMPADYFWKFEYWPKARAFATLEKIVSRVFASIMKQANEGELKIVDLSIDPLKIEITFKDCVECAGLKGFSHGICYYHAGTLAGILSGLINRDLSGIETACQVTGSESCNFTIGDSSEDEIKRMYTDYITPPVVNTDLVSRAEESLSKTPARSLGNMVDISYLQLAVANTLQADPEKYASSSYEIGADLGKKLAPVLTDIISGDNFETLERYYLQLGEFEVEINGDSSQLDLKIRECAESSGTDKLIEMTSFLTGELCGIISEMMNTEMKPAESRFEGENLLLTFIPE